MFTEKIRSVEEAASQQPWTKRRRRNDVEGVVRQSDAIRVSLKLDSVHHLADRTSLVIVRFDRASCVRLAADRPRDALSRAGLHLDLPRQSRVECDAAVGGNIARFINHSCAPNSHFRCDRQDDLDPRLESGFLVSRHEQDQDSKTSELRASKRERLLVGTILAAGVASPLLAAPLQIDTQ